MKIAAMDEIHHFTFVAGLVKRWEGTNMLARSLSDEATRGQRSSHKLAPVTAGQLNHTCSMLERQDK